MTDTMYFSIARDDKASGTPFRAYDKLQRDIRDIAYFPELAHELSELANAWQNVLRAYDSLAIGGLQ